MHAILSEKNKESFGKKTNRLQGRGSLAALLGEQESHGSQEPGQIVGRKQVIARRQRLLKIPKAVLCWTLLGLIVTWQHLFRFLKDQMAPEVSIRFIRILEVSRNSFP